MLEGLFSNTNKDKFYFVFLARWKPKKWSYNAAEYKILILIAYQKKIASKNALFKYFCLTKLRTFLTTNKFSTHQKIVTILQQVLIQATDIRFISMS